MGSGMSTPLGCSYVHRGTHRVSPMHPERSSGEKKKKIGSGNVRFNFDPNHLNLSQNVRLVSNLSLNSQKKI